MADFVPALAFESRALTREEASFVLADVRLAGIVEEELTDPAYEDEILLHNEASDSKRINHLQFSVAKVYINADYLTPQDMKTHLEL